MAERLRAERGAQDIAVTTGNIATTRHGRTFRLADVVFNTFGIPVQDLARRGPCSTRGAAWSSGRRSAPTRRPGGAPGPSSWSTPWAASSATGPAATRCAI